MKPTNLVCVYCGKDAIMLRSGESRCADCAAKLRGATPARPASRDTAVTRLVEKWRNRAAPNFADPEARENTLDYWRGVQRCADELEAALSEGTER